MFILLDSTASDFANAAHVDRIGVVPLADPMNSAAVAAETAADAALVEAAALYEAAEAAALAEVEGVVDEALVEADQVANGLAQMVEANQVNIERVDFNVAEMLAVAEAEQG